MHKTICIHLYQSSSTNDSDSLTWDSKPRLCDSVLAYYEPKGRYCHPQTTLQTHLTYMKHLDSSLCVCSGVSNHFETPCLDFTLHTVQYIHGTLILLIMLLHEQHNFERDIMHVFMNMYVNVYAEFSI